MARHSMNRVLSVRLEAKLNDDYIPVTFVYDPRGVDELLLVMGDVEWRCSLVLLLDGVHRPTGMGDIKFVPHHHDNKLFIVLSPTTGYAMLELDLQEVRYEVVHTVEDRIRAIWPQIEANRDQMLEELAESFYVLANNV